VSQPLVEETRDCINCGSEGKVEPELDGQVVVWGCTQCGAEEYEKAPGPVPADSCSLGIAPELRQGAPAEPGQVFIGGIGRRPQ
jgi:predicted  nucleic acid-binding Zn-ribbon protein